jgi:hypothetical protein
MTGIRMYCKLLGFTSPTPEATIISNPGQVRRSFSSIVTPSTSAWVNRVGLTPRPRLPVFPINGHLQNRMIRLKGAQEQTRPSIRSIRASVPQALNAHLCVGANPYIGSRRVFDDQQALAGRSGRDLST